MQTTISLKSTRREAGGKGPARRLRAAGKLPAIVYGPGHESVAVAVDPKDVLTILNAPLGRNTVVTLEIDGKGQLAMLKTFEYHPLTRELEHADFYTVALDRAIIVEVPLHTTGKPKGVAEGGILRQVYRKVPVKCTPDKIPAHLDIDVTNLELGSGLHARELPLPPGVTIMLEPGQTIVSVVAPEKEEKVAGPEAAAAVPGAPAAPGAPGAAAPAAGAAAPAAGGAAPAAKGAAPAKGGEKKK
jgi:large subunit ribosomal protein L25